MKAQMTDSRREATASFHDRMAAALRSQTVREAAKGEWKDGLEKRAKDAEARAEALREG